MDTDGNGTVEFNEFLSMMSRKMKDSDKNNEIYQAFQVFDKNGDGLISKKELNHIMKSLGDNLSEDEIEEMIQQADIDGDGEICFSEFVQFIMSH